MEEKSRVSEEMARAAAHWWAGKVDGHSRHNNGDRGLTGFFAGMLADSLIQPAGDEAVQKFEDILTEKIVKGSATEGGWYWSSFGCDYGPDQILSESAKEAGISCDNFPWKTFMHILPEDGAIMVYDGYQSPWKTIWKRDA